MTAIAPRASTRSNPLTRHLPVDRAVVVPRKAGRTTAILAPQVQDQREGRGLVAVEGVPHAGEEAAVLAQLGHLFTPGPGELAQVALLVGAQLRGRAHVEVHEQVAP